MPRLKQLFDRINDPKYSRYNLSGTYPTQIEGRIVVLKPQELLEVGRTYPSKEQVMIAYFGRAPTRVLYFGEDADSMNKTLNALRLPNSWPSNLGEKVFYLFRSHLRNILDRNNLINTPSGPVSLEQQVISGKEHQLGFVLGRLIEIYRMSEPKIYAAEKATLSGGVCN